MFVLMDITATSCGNTYTYGLGSQCFHGPPHPPVLWVAWNATTSAEYGKGGGGAMAKVQSTPTAQHPQPAGGTGVASTPTTHKPQGGIDHQSLGVTITIGGGR